jgi:hypothetical protein
VLSVFIAPLSVVPRRPPSDGVVVELGVVVDGVPLLEPMLPELGAVVSELLGDVVVLGDVLGDVVVLGVELSVVLGDVVGDCVLGDCVPGAFVLGELVLPESVPLVCAYTRPAPTASAMLVPTAMVLNLLIRNSCLRSG